MKPIKAKANNALNVGSIIAACDNSGAKTVKIIAVIKRGKTTKSRYPAASIADLIKVAVKKGSPDVKGKVFHAVIVRQRKEFRRLTGERIKFADSAAILLKDTKGNPQGTTIKGPIAREITERWPNVSKMASIVV